MLAPTESSCLLEYSCELTVQKLLSRLKFKKKKKVKVTGLEMLVPTGSSCFIEYSREIS